MLLATSETVRLLGRNCNTLSGLKTASSAEDIFSPCITHATHFHSSLPNRTGFLNPKAKGWGESSVTGYIDPNPNSRSSGKHCSVVEIHLLSQCVECRDSHIPGLCSSAVQPDEKALNPWRSCLNEQGGWEMARRVSPQASTCTITQYSHACMHFKSSCWWHCLDGEEARLDSESVAHRPGHKSITASPQDDARFCCCFLSWWRLEPRALGMLNGYHSVTSLSLWLWFQQSVVGYLLYRLGR